MEKLSSISSAEFQSKFVADKGVVVIPEGYALYKIPSAEELKQKEITRLQDALKDLGEPSQEELIELGRMNHPYYYTKMLLESFTGKEGVKIEEINIKK